MTPREEALLLYKLYHQPRNLAEDEFLHRRSGYVIESDRYYLMGRPVDRGDAEEHIRDPAIRYNLINAWFIWIFVGDIKEMLHLAPYPLPYVGWSRRNGTIRWYRSEEALARVRHYDINRQRAGVG